MMKSLYLLLLFCCVTSPVTHTLIMFFIGSHGVPNVPEFVAVAMVNGVEVIYCDSITTVAEPKQDWMETLKKDDAKELDWYTDECRAGQRFFSSTIEILMLRFNQTGGKHVFQRMFGCEWDDETGKINGFNQYGYDGEDFIELDLKTETWITPVQQGVITKHKWSNDKAGMASIKKFLTQECPDRLKKYVDYGRISLLRTDIPSVSLLQKSPSSAVSCHATGFYPDRAVIFWRKDGEEIHEEVDLGETLPNHDGSFQMSSDLNISEVPPEDWRRYECVFQLSSMKDDIITILDKSAIRTNRGREVHAGALIIRVFIVLILLAVGIIGVFMCKRKNNGIQPVNIQMAPS
ncbi:major histocompatibility complex class I-related gene protein-like [Plectropomus leopardus]|uniref:major histocompatibility complex class I-related gene protein-like n=1 Tax=Plectropomus leopardus TaxID=160734 RepID=UPI001C4D253C|nr:major histocompatibility complex class I-related gene protein-like [Plectropomus leopardus]